MLAERDKRNVETFKRMLLRFSDLFMYVRADCEYVSVPWARLVSAAVKGNIKCLELELELVVSRPVGAGNPTSAKATSV